jgi:hypothetical protein
MGFLGIVTIIGSLIYISWPVGHIPPYDANLTRLAESALQGYCSGKTLIDTGGGPDANMTAQCRATLAGRYSDAPNLSVVIGSFCQAILDGGWQGAKSDCTAIMAQNQYWPTYDGTITNAWNRARPYPVTFLGTGKSSNGPGSRTGSHTGNSRNINPTH